MPPRAQAPASRWAAAVAGTLLLLGVAALVVIPQLDRQLVRAGRPDLVQWAAGPAFAVLVEAVVGAVVAARRPRHPVGWLLLAQSLALILTGLIAQYLVWSLLPGHHLPATRLAAELFTVSAGLAYFLVAFVLLLTPTGSLPSPGWGWWARGLVAAPAVLFVAAIVAPGPVDVHATAVGGPFDPDATAGPLLIVNQLALVVCSVAVLGSAASLLGRFRRASGVERQQLRWVALATALLVPATATFAVSLAFDQVGLFDWAVLAWLTGLPLAIGAAVLRYRLYDLDRIVSRTLAYGLLTLLLGGAYAAVVVGLGQVVRQQSSLVVAGATLAVAAAFQPARRRVQDAVDRRFDRRRRDAALTIEAFSARLRQHVDLDTLSAELRAVVEQTMQPAGVSLWLRPR